MTSKLESKLRKFHIDIPYDQPKQWMPRGVDNIGRHIDAGLREITHNKREDYHRFGVTKKSFPIPVPCRFCGKPMDVVDESNNAIVMGCDTEGCPNNQDSKSHEFLIANQSRKRPIGTIEEDQFEQGY